MVKMEKSELQKAALSYATSSQPLDPDKGWQREDVQMAFMAGMEALPIRRLLSPPEAARILGVSASTIHDLVRHGKLAYVHAGRGTVRRHLTFSASEIESYIKRNTERVNYSPPAGTRRTQGGDWSDGSDFMAQYEARRAAAKAKKR